MQGLSLRDGKAFNERGGARSLGPITAGNWAKRRNFSSKRINYEENVKELVVMPNALRTDTRFDGQVQAAK